MALIECPDCKKSVSDRAPACPQCGAPIATSAEQRSIGTPVVTIQGTSKRLKGQLLLAVALGVAGIFMFYGGDRDSSGFGLILLLVGSIWGLIARLRIWWHHE